MKEQSEIHMPSPSYWPIVLAFGLTLLSSGVIWGIIIGVLGVIVILVSIAGWTLENRATGGEKSDE